MSKALELIRTLIDGANEYEKKTGNTNPTVYLSKNNLLIIQRALNRLESIDNANPSEALEYLEEIKKYFPVVDLDKTIEQALLKAQKEHKALEIIKEKNVSIFQLSCCKNVNEYNDLKFKDSEKLTEEEFSLLKEMLGC